jgi:hypothetical protein
MSFLGEKKLRVRKVCTQFYGLGSGSGPGKFEKSDPDKNRPDPQH